MRRRAKEYTQKEGASKNTEEHIKGFVLNFPGFLLFFPKVFPCFPKRVSIPPDDDTINNRVGQETNGKQLYLTTTPDRHDEESVSSDSSSMGLKFESAVINIHLG